VDFWFEFGSTYSYPAAMRIEDLAKQRGVTLRWRAFLLGPIFGSQGWDDSPFNLYPTKGRYMWRDLERICASHALDFVRPSAFPRNGLWAARVACWYAREPWLPAFVRAVYRANFAEDLEIDAPETLERCLAVADRDPAELMAAARSPEAKAKLREQSDEAVASGIFGAPSFVAAGELFWGHDRIDAALEWAERSPGDPTRER